jgi:DNA-binding IclR family transcriptional regulator
MRAADILILLGSHEQLGVSDIARSLGISKGVVHRILHSLLTRDLVSIDELTHRYQLGPAGVAIGAHALRQSRLRTIAGPVLRQLQAQSGETSALTMIVGFQKVHIDQVPSTQPVLMNVIVGSYKPLYRGASGCAILAFATADIRHRVFAEIARVHPEERPPSEAQLRRDIERTVREGVAVSRSRPLVGTSAVAAPILGMDGNSIGALTLCAPVERLDARRLVSFAALVSKAAAHVSAHLNGGQPALRADAGDARTG